MLKTTIPQAQSHNHVFTDVGFLKTQAVNYVLFKHYFCYSGTIHNVKFLKQIATNMPPLIRNGENEFLSGKFCNHINFLLLYCYCIADTQWHSLLRQCTTSQKITGLIPDGVIGIFHCHNPSSCTMALG
jgi:hypothetical protein